MLTRKIPSGRSWPLFMPNSSGKQKWSSGNWGTIASCHLRANRNYCAELVSASGTYWPAVNGRTVPTPAFAKSSATLSHHCLQSNRESGEFFSMVKKAPNCFSATSRNSYLSDITLKVCLRPARPTPVFR